MDALSPHTKVFIVDDDEAVRDSIKVLLEVHRIVVEDFASTDAFAKAYSKPGRGCLILDQHLPVVTGIDFLNSPAGKQLGIPVILITGRGDQELEKRARDAGVAKYLQKPVSERVLIAAVEDAIASQGWPPPDMA